MKNDTEGAGDPERRMRKPPLCCPAPTLAQRTNFKAKTEATGWLLLKAQDHEAVFSP